MTIRNSLVPGMGSIRRWQKRYFVLTARSLLYYDSKPASVSVASTGTLGYLGKIQLRDVSSVELRDALNDTRTSKRSKGKSKSKSKGKSAHDDDCGDGSGGGDGDGGSDGTCGGGNQPAGASAGASAGTDIREFQIAGGNAENSTNLRAPTALDALGCVFTSTACV